MVGTSVEWSAVHWAERMVDQMDQMLADQLVAQWEQKLVDNLDAHLADPMADSLDRWWVDL